MSASLNTNPEAGRHLPPGASPGKFARPDTMSPSRHVKAINGLFKALGKAQPDLIRIEAEIGEHYAEIRRILGYGSDQMKEWVADKLPGMDERHLRRCMELNQKHEDFEPAHKWYLKEGRALGWKTAHATGCRYALDVIRFHYRHQDGHEPPQPKLPGEGTRADTVAYLTELLDQQSAEISTLKKALEEAEWKAHQTVCPKCSGPLVCEPEEGDDA